MTATIRDVARAVGVSVATVSRALTGNGAVSDDTRRRIHAAASSLRYAPNASARSLVSSRTHTLGFLLPDLYGEFFSEVIRGADLAARGRGYHLLVSSTHDGRDEIESALRTMRGRVDGLLVMTPDPEGAMFAAGLPADLPVVLLNGTDAAAALHVVAVDSYGGARAMMRHLLALGHRRIAHVTGPARNHDADERCRGWRDGLREAGVAIDTGWERPGDFTEQAGYDGVRALFADGAARGMSDGARVPNDVRPTALFAANDATAIGAVSALHELGLRVPHDVAVAGFDDIPMARYVSPPLTSVHVAIPELGARAVARLVDALGGPLGAESSGVESLGSLPPGIALRRELLPATLVVRGSCGGRPPPDG